MENKEEKKIDNFVHLHCHSTYSFQDAMGLPDQYAKRVSEIGQPAIAITDHGNVSAHYKWYKNMNKVGVKPILGCEMYIVEKDENILKDGYYHITVIAKNNIGYSNLMKLVTKSWCEQFYYKPKITLKNLEEYKEGLIILSGCIGGMAGRSAMNNDYGTTERTILKMKEIFGEDFYVEIMPLTFKDGNNAYKMIIEVAQRHSLPMVATMDCHYIFERQKDLHDVILCIRDKKFYDDPDRFKYDQHDFYLKTREEMERDLKLCFPDFDPTEALDNTLKIAQGVSFSFPTAKPIKYPIPDEIKEKTLLEMCEKGMVERNITPNNVRYKEYRKRMDYELDLINKKNFVDYFLVIADLVRWAKDNDILVGPARGSAAGSLVCFLARITEVDPLLYDLIFERFIDINREDLPDIDLDFEDAKRYRIKDYLAEKYGKNKVGNLPIFAYFKSKNSIDDIARVFKIPFTVADKIKSLVIERSGGDSRASFTLEDTFNNELFTYPKEALVKYPELKYTIELEGQIRQIGQHAAGIVISNEPLTDFCAIYKIKDEQVLSLDYKDSTSIGLLKIDILGLNTLTVISKAIQKIKERTGNDIKIYDMKFDDKKVYKGFTDEKLFGVFQFDGQAVNQVSRQINPTDFAALYDISALARPGPLNGGSTTSYIQRRAGKEKVTYPHDLMIEYTKRTYGLVIYQEQVMRTMREIGLMSWKDTAEIRRLISKSQGVEKFNTFKEKFTIGAKKNGLTIPEIDKMWNAICTMGAWSFNLSHCVSYSMISYWTMYLKVYYPMEFYSSILSEVHDDAKKKKILKEYKKEKFKILGIDVNKSKNSFSIEGKSIRIGFKEVKGFGEKAIEKIVSGQPYTSYENFVYKSKTNRVGQKLIKILVDLGAFDSVPQSDSLNLFGESATFYSKETMSFNERFDICPWDMDFNIKDKWRQFYIDNKDLLFGKFPTPLDILKNKEGQDEVVIWGIVYDKNLRDKREVALSKNKKAITIKEGEPTQFCNFILEDDTDFITARLSVHVFPRYGNLIFEQIKGDDVIAMKGKMGSGIRMFFANSIVSLRHLKEQSEKDPDYKVKIQMQQSAEKEERRKMFENYKYNGKS